MEDSYMKERMRKLSELRESGVEPYPYSFDHTHHANDILEKYGKLKEGEETKDKVSVAGRIVLMRGMGKATFMHVQDQSGKIQLFIRKDVLGDSYSVLKKLDIGDIVGAEGLVFRTKRGEISVSVESFQLLSKSLRPLPEKFHGLKDVELRYRKRYVDLITNPEVKDVFIKRARIIGAVREFMRTKGFLEVETPMLQTIYGGAEAKPFVTHIHAWDMKMFMSISPELYLKRLLVGGYEKVFTICKNFRNEGVDRTHNPEFNLMEFYQAYADYEDMMKLTEELYEFVAMKVLGRTAITYDNKTIEFKAPWKRVTVKGALKESGNMDVDSLSDDQLKKELAKRKVKLEGKFSRGLAIMKLFEELCEKHIEQPTFVIDYPKEASPLCKVKRGSPELIEKVEPYVNGWEMGNGYSELNDPVVQKKLLENQAKQLKAGAEDAHPMDKDFVEAIEMGLPPAGGMGLGIDRMVILLAEQPSLRDVILFPTMRPKEE